MTQNATLTTHRPFQASPDIRDRSIKKINHLGKYFPRWGRKNESHRLAQLLQNDKFYFCDCFIEWVGKTELAKLNQGGQW